jgi:hypothetical protein
MTRLILQAGFSGDDDLVSPERGYNEFSELGSRQLGRGDVGRIAVSLCRSGIKSSFAFFFPFLLSCIHNSVLPPPQKKRTSFYGVLQKHGIRNIDLPWPSFRLLKIRLQTLHVWRQSSGRHAIKSILPTAMVQADLLFPAIIHEYRLLRQLLL